MTREKAQRKKLKLSTAQQNHVEVTENGSNKREVVSKE